MPSQIDQLSVSQIHLDSIYITKVLHMCMLVHGDVLLCSHLIASRAKPNNFIWNCYSWLHPQKFIVLTWKIWIGSGFYKRHYRALFVRVWLLCLTLLQFPFFHKRRLHLCYFDVGHIHVRCVVFTLLFVSLPVFTFNI